MTQPARKPDDEPGHNMDSGGGKTPFWIYLLAIGVAVTALILVLNWMFPNVLGTTDGTMHIVYLVALLAYLVLVMKGFGTIGAKTWIVSIVAWGGLLFALVVVYDLIRDIPAVAEWMRGRF